MITITGILKTPMNMPIPKAEIRIESKLSKGETVQTAIATYITEQDGNYSFNLVDGEHSIEVKIDDTFVEVGSAIVDGSTPNNITLSDLIKYTTPIQPTPVVPDNPTWENLFEDVRVAVDTFTQKSREQIVDDRVSDVELNEVYTNQRIDAEMNEVIDQNTAGDSQVTQNPLVYSDGAKQEAARNIQEVKVNSYKTSTEDSVYSDTSDNVEMIHKVESSTEHITATKEVKLEDNPSNTETVVIEDSTNATGTSIVSRISNAIGSIRDRIVRTITPVSIQITESQEVGGNSLTREDEIISLSSTSKSTVSVGSTDGSETLSTTASESKKEFDVDKFNIRDVFEIDTVAGTAHLKAQLTVENPDDFKGDKGDTIFQVFQYALDSTGPWHDDFQANDQWRRWNNSVNGVIDPTTWSSPVLFSGKDGSDGDSYYYEYQYSIQTPINWHDTFEDGDYWRRERIVQNGVTQPWSAQARIRGVDGEAGEIVTIEYEYSINGVSLWHSNFTTGDHYRRERTATYKFVGDTSPTYTAWSAPAKVVPEKGTDYFDGFNQATIYLYQRALTAPPAPTDVLTYQFNTKTLIGSLGGWSETVPAGTQNIYIATAATVSDTNTDDIQPTDWSVGLMAANGTAGIDAQIVRSYYQVAATQPIAPTGTTLPPAGWTDALPTNLPVGQRGWIVNTYADDASTNVGSGVWTSVGIWAGVDGIDGMLVRGVFISAPVSSPPSTPTGTNIPPTGWSETPPTPTTGEVVWVSYTYSQGTTSPIGTGDWAVPGQFSGEKGVDGLTVRGVWLVASSKPTQPSGNTIPPSGGWSEIPPDDIPSGQVAWASYTYAVDDVTTSGTGVWTEVGQWSGKQGVDGKIVRSVYRTATSVPARPTGTIIPPSGWSETPPSSIPDGQLAWVTSTYADDETTGTGTGNWLPVGQWSGNAGKDGYHSAVVMLVRASESDLTNSDRPTNQITYNFKTGKVVNTPNNSWSQTIPDNFAGKLWITSAAAASNNDTDIIPPSEWATPRLWVRDGSNGTGFYTIQKYSGVFPADSTATADFIVKTGRSPLEDDHLTYVDSFTNTNISSTKRYDGSGWVSPAQIIDGDLLVKGTITGDRLVANTIKGDQISSNTTITAGSGSNTAGMNGYDSGIYNGWRFWSGDTNPNNAEFRVNSSGEMFSTNGRIAGKMTVGDAAAVAGISGQGTANNSVRFWSGHVTPTSAPFRVYHDGSIYVQDGDFRGTVYAEKMIGDIYKTRVYTAAQSSFGSSWTTLLDVNITIERVNSYISIAPIALNMPEDHWGYIELWINGVRVLTDQMRTTGGYARQMFSELTSGSVYMGSTQVMVRARMSSNSSSLGSTNIRVSTFR